MDGELAELLERAVALEVTRQRRAIVGLGHRAQGEVHLLGLGPAADRRHGQLERLLEAAPRARRAAPISDGSHSQRSSTPSSPR